MTEAKFTLVQLRYFATAARLGSMTATSRELMVSQSAISAAIAQLERELDVQLLLRQHAKGLTLTDAGERFYRETCELLAHSVALADLAVESGHGLAGDLSIGCFTTLGPIEMPRLLAQLEDRHPGINPRVIEGEQRELKDALRIGSCELSLMYRYRLDADIASRRVGTAPPYVLVSADHHLAQRGSVSLAELADEPMILLDLPDSRDYLASVVASANIDPRPGPRSAGFESVRVMAGRGLGYAVLNQRPAHDLTYSGQRVVTLEIEDDVPSMEIVVAWLKGVRLSARAKAFIRVAIELAQENQGIG
ncbi:DNA-binding transcriptional LysR family regulator [Psychromicrobium silvestre]|uniref:DNA-binding transcriptional LysR family regulator n=1 Tax=Psychromicrobium silvestre TaxID=1645614 RepID=A0A7Y9S7J8_9MICC|nr:LysR substrate-binding domain-containing protein [Psychromicrobium silvestre]NYE95136.1 DNA-binding transcriptional LysR family regulator [Psychromicrobium silvestre]